jgi:hypothetical protein
MGISARWGGSERQRGEEIKNIGSVGWWRIVGM